MAVNIHQDSQLLSNVMEFVNEADGVQDLLVGGPAAPTSAQGRHRPLNSMKMALTNIGTDSGGGLLSWANPFPYSLIIVSCVLDVTTASTGTCTLEIGTTPTNATTVSTNMIAGQSVAATGTFNSGALSVKLAAANWVTVSTKAGTSTGLVANSYIYFHAA